MVDNYYPRKLGLLGYLQAGMEVGGIIGCSLATLFLITTLDFQADDSKGKTKKLESLTNQAMSLSAAQYGEPTTWSTKEKRSFLDDL